jgi:iron complex outermembrane receptor protein
LTLQLSGSYLDTRQKDVPSPLGGVQDYQIPDAPKWSAHGLVRYDFRLASGVIGLQADGAYVGTRTTDAVDTPALELPAYFRANASLDFVSAKSGWNATLWCKNLANKDVINFKTNLAALVGGAEVIYDPPRTYGITVGYRWR